MKKKILVVIADYYANISTYVSRRLPSSKDSHHQAIIRGLSIFQISKVVRKSRKLKLRVGSSKLVWSDFWGIQRKGKVGSPLILLKY